MIEIQEMLEIHRYQDGKIAAMQDAVVVERLVSLAINNKITFHHSISPALYAEFAIGFLLTSGMASTFQDISELLVHEDTISATVRNLRIPAGCGKGAGGGLLPLDFKKSKISLRPRQVDYASLEGLFADFSRRSAVFRQTGGTHSAALSAGGRVVFFAEDIGRHNAIDKVVGAGAMAGIDLADMLLLTSGRISTEIVNKAGQVRLSGVISHSAPTSLAVRLATQYGMRLIGFLRGNRFNIYS